VSRLFVVSAHLSSSDKIALAAAVATVLTVLVGLGALWLAISNERRRTQPIVVSNEARARHLEQVGGERVWQADVYLTSDGDGPAFNVQFGVAYHGVRYGQRLKPDDPPSGNVQRLLKPGERRPTEGAWPVIIDSLSVFGAGQKGDIEDSAVYWARYENAYGKTWETRNPGDRTSRLDIRRVRFRSLRERYEGWRRDRARQHGAEWERKIVSELSFEGSLRTNKLPRSENESASTQEEPAAAEGVSSDDLEASQE
jgi:hypothetical protein